MARNISLRIGNNLGRKNIIVSSEDTIVDIFAKEDMTTTNGKIHINGIPVTAAEANTPIGELLPNQDSADLMVVIKSDNA